MKKRVFSALLALTLCLGLMPAASAAEASLPDWYFLFAIFKNVDADCTDKNGMVTHIKYSMTQDEIDFAKEDARDLEEFMDQVGVMRAHVDVVEIDDTVTELHGSATLGSYLGSEQAAPLLNGKVDLDRYDHVTCFVSLNVSMGYLGVTGGEFENGNGHACINLKCREYCLDVLRRTEVTFSPSMYVHEFLHVMERRTKKFDTEFGLHDIRINFYTPDEDNGKECYTDIILNRAKGNAGTGVHPAAWQYPPHVLRTMTRLTVPSSAASIGYGAFRDLASLSSATFSSGVTNIGIWSFGDCTALTRVSLPASVTKIDYAAFWNTGIKDVYYGGTEGQWKAIEIGDYNGPLTNATIHYNSLMADVKTTDWYAKPVAWALEKGITVGTGGGNFSPGNICTQGQILTFLWRAKGEPRPDRQVSGSEFYAAAVQWAKEQGLVGVTLDPGSPCSRADVMSYLWALAGSPGAGSASFSDVPVNASYAQAVAWAAETGVTSGVSATRFAPEQTCTRGQIVTFLYRALAK